LYIAKEKTYVKTPFLPVDDNEIVLKFKLSKQNVEPDNKYPLIYGNSNAWNDGIINPYPNK